MSSKLKPIQVDILNNYHKVGEHFNKIMDIIVKYCKVLKELASVEREFCQTIEGFKEYVVSDEKKTNCVNVINLFKHTADDRITIANYYMNLLSHTSNICSTKNQMIKIAAQQLEKEKKNLVEKYDKYFSAKDKKKDVTLNDFTLEPVRNTVRCLNHHVFYQYNHFTLKMVEHLDSMILNFTEKNFQFCKKFIDRKNEVIPNFAFKIDIRVLLESFNEILNKDVDPNSFYFKKNNYNTVNNCSIAGHLFKKKKNIWVPCYCTFLKSNYELSIYYHKNKQSENNQIESHMVKEIEINESGQNRLLSIITDLNELLIFQTPFQEEINDWIAYFGRLSRIDADSSKYTDFMEISDKQTEDDLLVASMSPDFDEKRLKFVLFCIEKIKNLGLEEQGIYRISSTSRVVNILIKSLLLDPSDEHLSNYESFNEFCGHFDEKDVSHCLFTNAIKKVFKYLPILPKEVHDALLSDEFYVLLSVFIPKYVVRHFRMIPKKRLDTIIAFFTHLKEIALYSAENLMTHSNLAIVTGPSIFSNEIKSADFHNINKTTEILISRILEINAEIYPQESDPADPMKSLLGLYNAMPKPNVVENELTFVKITNDIPID